MSVDSWPKHIRDAGDELSMSSAMQCVQEHGLAMSLWPMANEIYQIDLQDTVSNELVTATGVGVPDTIRRALRRYFAIEEQEE